ncbi:MAG: hypothetical protein GTO53_09975, partial [Planctomycetales bacterium]|nr:hypothetical protein [Planctomycetales bacterium]NIM09447.1 hypothetical protein [Planctomycetales bacterium]NIN08929.1 hypothetical protein [Planctomycetales bacterium]NIN78050.1 hypothetical protein [Planctomycetales bacterium]NIO35228.1 hypothetical protein [Planctomycetales bacterium]
MKNSESNFSPARQEDAWQPGGLRIRLLRSHLLVAALGLLMLVIALGVFIWQRRNAIQLAKISGPAAGSSALALAGVHNSQANLRAWVLLGDRQFIVEREHSWEKEIEPALRRLRSLSNQWQ